MRASGGRDGVCSGPLFTGFFRVMHLHQSAGIELLSDIVAKKP
jgi:hypothetical protein